MAQQKQIQLGTMRLWVLSLVSLSGLRIRHCRELSCRPAATAPIRPLTWESVYALGAALNRQKTKKKKSKMIYFRKSGKHNNAPKILFSFLAPVFLPPRDNHY